MKRAILKHLLLLIALYGLLTPLGLATPSLMQFPTEQAAQEHCPSDIVVWINTHSGIYHFKGQRWYGNTKGGAYVCKKEADSAGDRATRNGQ